MSDTQPELHSRFDPCGPSDAGERVDAPDPPLRGSRTVRLGVVGAGKFARFVLDAVAELEGVHVVAVTDVDPDRAAGLIKDDQVQVVASVNELIELVDVVVVATPPSTHARTALTAIAAGRHVFCEKPLATTAADARAVVAAANRAGVVVVVDHVLRHNPLLAGVVRLRDAVLGPVQRFVFENDASDEHFGPEHCFWDDRSSGGLLIEHAVHFFDLAHWLLDSHPTAVQASGVRRGGPLGDLDGLLDMISVTATHPGGALATHTHSFTHADRCERQWLRLGHGAAETVISGWVPLEASVDLWTDDAGVATVHGLLADPKALFAIGPVPGPASARSTCRVERDAAPPAMSARGRTLSAPHRVRIELIVGGAGAKQQVYTAGVRSAVADLVHCASTGEQPRSNVVDAAAAVIVAAGATRALHHGTSVSLLLPPPPLLAPVKAHPTQPRPPASPAQERP